MRVGINTLFLIPGEVGGSETYLRRTLSAMVRLFAGDEFVLFTNRENDGLFRKDHAGNPRVTTVRLDFNAANRFVRIAREQIELPIRVHRAGIDVLWSPGYTAPLFCTSPQAVSILDMQYKSHPEDLSLLARFTTHMLITGAVHVSKRVITISDFSKKEILKYTSAAPHRIHTTLLAVSPDFEKSSRTGNGGLSLVSASRQTAEKLRERPYVLSVANTYPHKGIHLLVDAFRLIEQEIPHNLVLVGLPRRGEIAVIKAVGKLRNPHRILRMSKITVIDLIELYRHADLFVFPSFYEGFGLPVLEAMMAGTPVVTTMKGSIPEIGTHHVIYADPLEAGTIAGKIKAVLHWPPERRRKWIEAAKNRAADFDWDITARNTMEVLKTVSGPNEP